MKNYYKISIQRFLVAICLSIPFNMVSVISEEERGLWAWYCNEGNYGDFLEAQYNINDPADAAAASKWRVTRFNTHYEFPVAYAELHYFELQSAIKLSDPEMELNRLRWALKTYMRALARIMIDSQLANEIVLDNTKIEIEHIWKQKFSVWFKHVLSDITPKLLKKCAQQAQQQMTTGFNKIHPFNATSLIMCRKRKKGWIECSWNYARGFKAPNIIFSKELDLLALQSFAHLATEDAWSAAREDLYDQAWKDTRRFVSERITNKGFAFLNKS